MAMMSYDQWMKDTAVFAKVRSKELVAVDKAMQNYHAGGATPEGKQQLKDAFETWKRSKGVSWRSSDRNKLRAIEKLDVELNVQKVTVLDQKELEALRFIAEHNKNNLKVLLGGKRLVLKNTSKGSTLNDVVQGVKEVKGHVTKAIGAAKSGAAAPATSALNNLLKSLFDTTDIGLVTQALGPAAGDFVAAATPIVGYVKEGLGLVGDWAKVAKGYWDRNKAKETQGSFAPGDPAAAFDAILVIMTKKIADNIASAGMNTAAFVVNTTLTATGVGAVGTPIVSAVKALAELTKKVYDFAQDWKEMKAANDLLAKGVADASLFKANPLLGAYLLSCSDTSAVVNFVVADFGKPGWKLDIEAMWKKAEPVIAKAREAVQGSRFEIPELKNYKGAVANSTGKTLGIPTGKIGAFKSKIEDKINSLGQS